LESHRSDIPFLSHLVFPSLYGWFTIPDLVPYACKLLEELVRTAPPEISIPFVSSFFESCPGFLETLICEYNSLTLNIPHTHTPTNCFRCLLPALGIAVRRLSEHHRYIARLTSDAGLFGRVFIGDVLMSTFYIDDPGSPVLIALRFTLEHPKLLAFRLISRAFLDFSPSTSELEAIGGFAALHVKHFDMLISPSELRLLVAAQNGTKPTLAKLLTRVKPGDLASRTPGILRFYPHFDELAQPLHTFLSLPSPGKVRSAGHGFHRTYEILSKRARDDDTTLLEFTAKESVWPGYASEFALLRRRVPLLETQAFRNFTFFMFLSQAHEKMVLVERFIARLQILRALEGVATFAVKYAYRLEDAVADRALIGDADFALRRRILRLVDPKCEKVGLFARKLAEIEFAHEEEAELSILGKFGRILALPVGKRIVALARFVEDFPEQGKLEKLWSLVCVAQRERFFEACLVFFRLFNVSCGDQPFGLKLRESYALIWSLLKKMVFAGNPELEVSISEFLTESQ
jgi:hypothetical protein